MDAVTKAHTAARTALQPLIDADEWWESLPLPQCVIDTAWAAYRAAGGAGEIEFTTYGDTQHASAKRVSKRVCGVIVNRKRG